MKVSPKAALAALSIIAAMGTALITFGLSKDSGALLRDAATELKLIHDGPTRLFLDICREFAIRREQSFLSTPAGQESPEERVNRLLGMQPGLNLTNPQLQVTPLLWCPFPSRASFVSSAVALVSDHDRAGILIWPHSAFLESLGDAIRNIHKQTEQEGESSTLAFAKLHDLAVQIASGHPILQMEITSDARAGTHTMFECASIEAIYDDGDAKVLPKFPIQLVVTLDGGATYCFRGNEVPPNVVRLYSSHSYKISGFYAAYFGRLIQSKPTYSNKAAIEFGIREIHGDKNVVGKDGSTRINEWFGFDFPALRGQMKDIGSLSVDAAYSHLLSKIAAIPETVDVFNMKLPIRIFLLTMIIGLPLSGWVFLLGFRVHGRLVLPKALQGLPWMFAALVTVGVICLMPTMGLLLSAVRLQFALPNIAPLLAVAGAGWGSFSLFVLVWMYRKHSKTARTKVQQD